jgi:hypothetical protein
MFSSVRGLGLWICWVIYNSSEWFGLNDENYIRVQYISVKIYSTLPSVHTIPKGQQICNKSISSGVFHGSGPTHPSRSAPDENFLRPPPPLLNLGNGWLEAYHWLIKSGRELVMGSFYYVSITIFVRSARWIIRLQNVISFGFSLDQHGLCFV